MIAEEQFFVVHAPASTLTREGRTIPEHALMVDHRWWSADELRDMDDVVWPDDLPSCLPASAW